MPKTFSNTSIYRKKMKKKNLTKKNQHQKKKFKTKKQHIFFSHFEDKLRGTIKSQLIKRSVYKQQPRNFCLLRGTMLSDSDISESCKTKFQIRTLFQELCSENYI